MDLAVGTVIGGRYRLDRMIGEGGMGAVWAATHTITGGRVALKFVKASADARSEMRKRFEREARAATLVEHPNVVTIRDIFDHDDTPVIVMDLLQGETLAALLARNGKLTLGEAAQLILPVIAAVGAAHEAGLIHRDLKPENVFLSRAPTGERVRVLDFGIAKLVRRDVDEFASTAVTQSGAVIGTPAYMAPEQLFGEKNLDYRVDVWALGVMLFEMLAGERPIDGENFGQLAKKMLMSQPPLISDKVADLPPDVVGLITRMLSRERDDRLRDLREAAAILAPHAAAPLPTFGAPRSRPLEDSGDSRVIVSTGTDPNAKTVLGGDRRTTDPNAQTMIAARSDTATAHVTGMRRPPRSYMPMVLGAALIALGGMVALRMMPQPPAPVATSASTPIVITPVVAAPLVAPKPTPIETMATPEPPATTSAAPSVLPLPGKPPKGAPPRASASVSAIPSVATVAAPPVPSNTAPPSATTGSGLVTKPPF